MDTGVKAAPDIEAAASFLRQRVGSAPEVALVLGSGLGGLADDVADPVVVPFAEVPGFPPSGVEGHAGRYVAGRLGGRDVLVQAGRFHAYEGHPMDVVVAPVRVAAALGIRVLVLTNAAGGIAPELGPGDLVLLDDHVNLMARHPLVGPVQPGEERFPDMSAPYDPELQRLAVDVASGLGTPLARGTYAAVLGPSYETPAEVRMLASLGADIVGMSTVPEVIAARALGIRCLAFSLVTNKATGTTAEPIEHAEVVEMGRQGGPRLAAIVLGVLEALPAGAQSTGAP